jgi:hypothetical protein
MTHNPEIDLAIRKARHLLFAFDGPIRSRNAGDTSDPNTPTAPHIYEALVACYESGRGLSNQSYAPLVSASFTPDGGVSVQENLGGVDQSRGSLK